MSRRRRYAGIASFPWSLPVDVDALGLVEHVTIGGHKVTMKLPTLGGGGLLQAPTDHRGKPLPPQMLKAFEGKWGYRSSERSCYGYAASASILLYPHVEMHNSEQFNSLSDSFFSWFKVVQEWAATWTGTPLGNFDKSHNSAFHIASGMNYLTASPVLMRTLFVEKQPLSRAQLRLALRHASCGEHLPVEHRMLLSSTDAQLGGDLRRAVIDAATAAEVALASYISDALEANGLDREFIDKMIEAVNGVVALYELCTRLGGEPVISKGKLMNELARVRNLAVHGGQTPTPQKAAAAREHATTIIRALRPLPQV
ncbi:hypothetical protein [Streptomyces sp. NPDC127072]|uniref:hypothetical protein n=1 Tax=Streptomyces sp. NPDC127072 TaxID=3347129 RepID=UPI00364C9A17